MTNKERREAKTQRETTLNLFGQMVAAIGSVLLLALFI